MLHMCNWDLAFLFKKDAMYISMVNTNISAYIWVYMMDQSIPTQTTMEAQLIPIRQFIWLAALFICKWPWSDLAKQGNDIYPWLCWEIWLHDL